ncbi:MAG: flagellar hook basal-body protein [Planctomycetota bacterium]
MDVGLYRMVAAMRTNQQRVEIVASNIANAETLGFKRMLHVAHGATDWAANQGHEQVVTGTALDLQQGIFMYTGAPTDLALDGEGFFLLDGPNGEVMTRAGMFQISAEGVLTSADGSPVVWEGSRGRIDPTGGEVKFAGNGQVIQGGQPIGRLKLVNVERAGDVVVDSDGRYTLRSGAEYIDSEVTVNQGFLERANVQTVDELVEMIAAQRSFEMASQTFKLISESYQRLNR